MSIWRSIIPEISLSSLVEMSRIEKKSSRNHLFENETGGE